MKKEQYYIYQYIDPRPGAESCVIYIGKGKKSRCNDHLVKAYNPLLRRIIAKIREHGLEPKVEIVASFDDEAEAFDAEKELILLHGRRDLGLGSLCNLTDGGDGAGGYCFTQEQRLKISSALKAKYAAGWDRSECHRLIAEANKGRVFSAESREKMSAAKRGKKLSAATLEKLSEVRMGHAVLPETREKIAATLNGHAVSEETRRKIGDANRGKIRTPEQRARLGKVVWTQEMRDAQSASVRSRPPRTEAHRAALSAALKGKPNGRLGKPRSEETKAKIAAAHKGRVKSDEHLANLAEAQRRRRAKEAMR
jgi:hypothetical protein